MLPLHRLGPYGLQIALVSVVLIFAGGGLFFYIQDQWVKSGNYSG